MDEISENDDYNDCLEKGESYIWHHDKHSKAKKIEVEDDEYICFLKDGEPVVVRDPFSIDRLFEDEQIKTKHAQIIRPS